MADQTIPNLKSFDAYSDHNGQMTDRPTERADPAGLKRAIEGNPDGESETARIASGHPNDDATAETEAEIPADVVEKLSNPSLKPT